MKKSIIISILFIFSITASTKAQYYVSTLSGYSFYQSGPDPTAFSSIEFGFNHYLTKSGNYWYLSWNGGTYAGGVTHRSPATCSLTPPCTAIWEKNTTAPSLFTYHPWVGPSGTETINITTGGSYKCSLGTLGTRAYVDHSATGANDGSSWGDAFKSLEAALVAARTCGVTEIWVADGTYKPSGYPTNISFSPILSTRDYTFHLVDGVKLYGGFTGFETSLAARLPCTKTILSGDLLGDDIGFTNNSENAYHVVSTVGDANTTLIDGFTIKNGNANIVSGDIVVESQALYKGNGGGLNSINSQIKVENVVFENNKAYYGGGMQNLGTSGTLLNVIFSANTAIEHGGGLYNLGNANPTITNCVFTDNNSQSTAGSIFNFMSSPSITNSTFSNNTAALLGNGIFNGNSSNPIIKNCIIWDTTPIINLGGSTPIISFSTLIGIDSNPLFVNPLLPIGTDGCWRTADDGLRLQNTSPAINSSSSGTLTPVSDITNFVRLGVFDRGAYEFPFPSSFAGGLCFVNHTATGANNGSSWADAFTNFQTALEASRTGGVTEIWVAKGTYNPSKDLSGNITGPNYYKTFSINNDVKIYGGFDGGELLRNLRNPQLNPTILSGDLGVVGTLSDNSFTVLHIGGTSIAGVLDGFTITKGHSYYLGFTSVFNGGGIYMSNGNSIINDCKFLNNHADGGGGAIMLWASGGFVCSPKITNCYFYQNAAIGAGDSYFFPEAVSSGGGAIKLYGQTSSSLCAPLIENCIFNGNVGRIGGAINSTGYNCNPTILNSVFLGNFALSSGIGGAIYNQNSNTTITNCTFNANTAPAGGNSIHNQNSILTLSNSILWGSTNQIQSVGGTVNIGYCDIQGYSGAGSGGNIDINPLFVNPIDPDGADNIWRTNDDGLRLNGYSAGKDVGDNSTATSTTEIRGLNRVENGVVDLGAYEIQTCTSLPIPCVLPSGVSSAPPLAGCLAYISVYDPSNIHVETVEYNNGSFTLNPFVMAGNYKIVLHTGSAPTLTPSLPCGYTAWLGDNYGGASDGMPNGLITIYVNSSGVAILLNSRISAVNDISFSMQTAAPLPIKLISFDAKAVGNTVELSWKTSSETNSAGFDIERSENGKEFTKIGYVKSDANNGNSQENLAYRYIDQTPPSGVGGLFYRLKQLDLDGKFEYSKIKMVEIESDDPVKVYPNPTSDFINIEINKISKIKNIQLVNAKGSIVYHSNLYENKIDISNQPTGIYFLKIEETSGKITVKKVLKN